MELNASAGTGNYRVTLQVLSTGGHGLSGFLYGGTQPHVGGVALVAPGTVLQGHAQPLSSCDEWSLTVPGHKDFIVANAIAKKLCLATKEPVSISAGIHIDHASKAEIQTLIDNCLEAAGLFLKQYGKE